MAAVVVGLSSGAGRADWLAAVVQRSACVNGSQVERRKSAGSRARPDRVAGDAATPSGPSPRVSVSWSNTQTEGADRRQLLCLVDKMELVTLLYALLAVTAAASVACAFGRHSLWLWG
ncbi:hypothetical protein CIHG_00526 [Coccidioides immitis H538.4]|uniref:Uncharacterized protein n=3 Tax=Coccidioides immitis TaxID=5501 RepID=A0A0J8QHG5_COCIT|nr:hypothetical protein CIRG_07340 [Coccidioides immitis RMSCC 2394]KMU71890.1 hypothetical protein CISG_00199 [Coccidioides immitis RMSCC 3703]KMU82744.1 hypothetical protein CIHG_00526 [Coccidioides immitis H538.4]